MSNQEDQVMLLNKALDAWGKEVTGNYPKRTPEQEAERAARIAEQKRLRDMIPASLQFAQNITHRNIHANAKKQAKQLAIQYAELFPATKEQRNELIEVLSAKFANWWYMGISYESDRRDGY